MGDFDRMQVKDKMERIQNGKSAYGSMLLTQYCQMSVKLFGVGPLVTLCGVGECLWSQHTVFSTQYGPVED